MKTINQITKLIELTNYSEISERLKNVLINESNNGTLPFETISDYLQSGSLAKVEFGKIPNLGKKSIDELDELVQMFNHGELQLNKSLDIPDRKYTTRISDLIKHNNVSLRLKNIIEAEIDGVNISFSTVGEYLTNRNDAKKEFGSLANMGRKTLEELDELIAGYVTDEMINDSSSNGENEQYEDDETIATGYIGYEIDERDANVTKIIKNVLSDNEYEVIYLRAVKNKTLEEVGTKKNVTRERIRQIEKKARLKFKVIPIFTKFTNKVDSMLDDASGEISIIDMVNIFKINSDVIRVMLYIYLELTNEKTVLKELIVYRTSSENNHKLWNKEIDYQLYSLIWPIEIDKLHYKLLDIPKNYLFRYIVDKRGAEISNNQIIKLNNISRTVKVQLILRMEKKPMHTSELTKKFNEFFNEQYNEHNITSIVGKMSEALIVDRGVYALYDYLDTDDKNIDEIRNKVYEYLLEEQRYISSKIIYQEIINKIQYDFPINEYTLHGILQDDCRFMIKRGFMVGLHDFSNKVIYKSLGKQIEDVVKNYGPVSNK